MTQLRLVEALRKGGERLLFSGKQARPGAVLPAPARQVDQAISPALTIEETPAVNQKDFTYI